MSLYRDGKPPNFIKKALIGVTAGGIGAFVGTPAEVALIRMTADGRWVVPSVFCFFVFFPPKFRCRSKLLDVLRVLAKTGYIKKKKNQKKKKLALFGTKNSTACFEL